MTDPTTIRVALADDHILVRAGLSQIINKHSDMQVHLQAAHGQELLDTLPSAQIDVVLLDIDMPVMDGKTTLEHLKKEYPELKIIMLTFHQHDSFIVHMMESGAHGYLLKESEPEEVISAIRTVVKEGVYFNSRVSKALLGRISKQEPSNTVSFQASLNQREIDVLKLICKEQTTSQIAENLFLSPKTIEGYRKSLLQKTGAKNAVGLAIYATKNGLV